MQLKLKVIGGERDGTEIPVPGPKFLIGRDADCNLRPNSEMISRHHCIVIVEQGYVGLRDFNSKNGTFVNGERICGERELKTGDELGIGNLRFVVHMDYSLGGPKNPKVKDISDAVARTADTVSTDDSIDEWLIDDPAQSDASEEDSAKTLALSSESLNDTAELRLQDDVGATKAGPAAGGDGLAAEAADQKPKDTRDAAMDVLRKFRKQQLEKQRLKQQQNLEEDES
ncbi:MAG: FHA domain-containing protein [Planctomycetales bacterium]|nr:FHA domain-containing protein [Planctomycetales bacterium]NIM08492.1 FHA domain-containing protein [Planctomycetales bacterium]NIN07969.1 FHA domain-containing protein [Planctomycetales bacterium]NIN77098.1 FHA domain-containing protein [Planctomycetales bacterium]NIO34278.1 FHA domain-containing protein [Planctomycetales bacterium]